MRRLLPSVLFLVLFACSDAVEVAPERTATVADAAAGIAAESARLNTWLDEQFQQELDFSPEWKTSLGDKSDYDKLNDVSEAEQDRQMEWRRGSVAAMRAGFDYEKLNDEAKTSFDLWAYALDQAEAALPFRRHGFIFGRGGPHAELPNFLINYHRVDTAADAQAYIARLNGIDEVMAQYLERSRRAAADGIRQPRFAYDFAIAEIGRVMSGAPFTAEGDSPLWADVTAKIAALQKSGAITAEQADTLIAAARTALLDAVRPAYDDVLAWLEADREHAPVQEVGAWTLPDGEAYYDSALYEMTTQKMTAAEVHTIGLAEVARIRAEMTTIMERVGFTGTLAEFFVSMRDDQRSYFPDTDEGRTAYLDLARTYLDGVNRKLPEYFGMLPKAGLEVRRVEAFREQDGAAQHYSPGTPDGSRPGTFYAHLSDMRAMPRYQLESVTYHEGNPGHHMQISIAQELTGIPRFRTQYWYTAYGEGWGLYAEALAKDMGFYQDPYSDFGRLASEMWRAIRLVVDTGLHAKRWSEEQAVRYFLDNSPQPEAAMRSEVQRYITDPGQATAYKIGMLKIQQLRAQAQSELGERFDMHGFHDTVLGGGSLPLPLLEARVARWIAGLKGGN